MNVICILNSLDMKISTKYVHTTKLYC